MKKVISALSSLVIAATALGGTCVVNTTAATNGTVDNTIIDIQTTEGKAHEIQAKAGDKIPFDIYIPQSNGFNTLSLLFSINGDATKGQDPALCDGATSYTLKKNTKLGKEGETITHPELFGNYGIKMSKEKSAYASPNCLYSGYLNMNPVNAGNPMRDGYAYVTPEFYTLMLVCNSYQLKKKDADAYGAWIKAGGNKNWEDEYDDYTPVSTWTADESWAYDYALFHSELELPANLPDGTYVFDVYTGNYVGSQFLEDFNAVNADGTFKKNDKGEFVQDPDNGVPLYIKSSVSGVSGEKTFKTKPLTIKVGNGTATTTSTNNTTVTTTTSTTPKTNPQPTGLTYDLIARGYDNTLVGNNNVATVPAGEKIKVDWIVTNDATEVGGLEFTFDLSQVTYVSNRSGDAYDVEPTVTDTDPTKLNYVFAVDKILHAESGSKIHTITVKVPDKEGEYTIGLKSGEHAICAGHAKGSENEYTFHGLTLKVGNGTTQGGTTTQGNTTTTSTTPKSNPQPTGLTYDLVPRDIAYTLVGSNNVATVAPGAKVKVDWIVTNDAEEVGGLEFTFDLSQVTYVSNRSGDAYDVEPTITDTDPTKLNYVFAVDKILHAESGSTIHTINVQVPDKEGEYTIGLKSGEHAICAGHAKGSENEYTFHGLTLKVVDGTTTTATTTTSTATTTTVTSTDTTTSTSTTTTSTSSSIIVGDVFYGDVNCDKAVDIADVILLNRYLAGTATPSDQGLKNANCQKDNNVDAKDSKVIKGYLALFIEYKVLGTETAESTLDAAIAAQK